MVRVPNYIYRGDDLGIGQGISNLGAALFGDPQAQAQLEATRQATEAQQLAMENSRYELETKRPDREKNDALVNKVLEAWGLGASDLYGDGGGAPQTLQAAASAAPAIPAPQPTLATSNLWHDNPAAFNKIVAGYESNNGK